MKGATLLFFLGLNVLCVLANANRTAVCRHPRVRKEWRTLSIPQRHEYIRAVKCLWTIPAKGSDTYPVLTRHDDFAATHINATMAANLSSTGVFQGFLGPGIHKVGVFLPWHRYFLWQYENALINECGYQGAQPYWDWSLDVPEYHGAQFADSPIFDPITGFGGNGANGSVVQVGATGVLGDPIGSCIADGPFANFTIDLSPGPPPLPAPPRILLASNDRCLHRNFQGYVNVALGWKANVLPLLALDDYRNFTYWVDGDLGKTGSPSGIHGGGHGGVGGEMLNVWSSTNDPLFFMHHGNLDRIWTLWQNKTESNVYAHGGPTYPNGTGTTTLESVMWMDPFIGPNLPIRVVADNLNRDGKGILCYEYEDSPYEP